MDSTTKPTLATPDKKRALFLIKKATLLMIFWPCKVISYCSSRSFSEACVIHESLALAYIFKVKLFFKLTTVLHCTLFQDT